MRIQHSPTLDWSISQLRASVGTGANILVGGFAIGGTTADTVLDSRRGPD